MTDCPHAELVRYQATAAALRARLAQLEASRVLRWSSPLRSVYAAGRSRWGAAPAAGGSRGADPAEVRPDPAPPVRLRDLTPIAATLAQPGRPQFLYATDDTVIGPALAHDGAFDAQQMTVALDVVAGLGRAGGAFIDVGANIGTATVAALWDFGYERALCLEPDELNGRLLRCNLVMNGLEDRVVVQECAVSDSLGEVVLELATDNRGDHRVRVGEAQQGAFDEDERATRRVPAVTLDEALDRAGLHPDDLGVIWVDTQGHEGRVLAGARGAAAGGVPFVVELWPYGLRRAEGLEQFLRLAEELFTDYTHVGRPDEGWRPTRELPALVAMLTGNQHADLVLRPR